MDGVFEGISDITKFVVDDDNAKVVYDVLQVSYVGKNKKLPPSQGEHGYELEFRYVDGVLYIEEQTTKGWAGYISELLDFLIPYDSYYYLRVRCKNGVPSFYDINDEEGKYFVRPPKTQWEIADDTEREKMQEQKKMNGDDMPF